MQSLMVWNDLGIDDKIFSLVKEILKSIKISKATDLEMDFKTLEEK